jgi:hypothetical protein
MWKIKLVLISLLVISFFIIFDQVVYAQAEPFSAKIWFITSNDSGCSNTNYEAILFIQSIAFVYTSIYGGLDSKYSPPQCLYLKDFENSPQKLADSMKNFDLPILIFDSEIKSKQFQISKKHTHFEFVLYPNPHIVFCYCSIPAESHVATWAMSHQLSHFILKYLGASELFYLKWVHEKDKDATECIQIRRQPGLCSTRWTPVFGISPIQMITVKVHPDLVNDLTSLEQMELAKNDFRYNQPSFDKNFRWINQIEDWYKDGLISKLEFDSAVKFISKLDVTENLIQNMYNQSQGNVKTTLKLNRINAINAGSPIIFSGSLNSNSGFRIENVEILIKSDSGCPSNGIIAQGFTDKNGKFLIKTTSMVWNTDDRPMNIFAKFLGNDVYASSSSRTYNVATNSGNGQNCNFIEGLS